MTRYIRGYGLISSDSEQARTYYHYVSDEKGSVTHLVSSEGEGVLNEYNYDVFGNRTVLKETVDNLFGYTGQQYDGITGQYYLRARYYNPVIGRFIQEDTYYGDGLNLYAYCCNNPVMYYDPTGHEHEANHNPKGHEAHHNSDGLDVADSPDPGSNNGKKTSSREEGGGSGNGSDKPDANESKPKVSNDGTDSSNSKPEADVPDDKPSQGGSKTVITPEMEEKILFGKRKDSAKNELIGGHSPDINNSNPNYAVKVVQINPDGTQKVKFVTQYADGNLSKIKTSTLFPNGWSNDKIINNIKKVGDIVTSGYPTGGLKTGLLTGFSSLE